MATLEWKTQLLRRTTAGSELGGISLAGQIRGSPGVGVANRPMRVFGQYAVVYIVGGGGNYRDANGKSREVSPGDLIWVFPKLAHGYGPREGESWDEIYLCFHGPVFKLWEKQGLIDQRFPVWRLEPVEYWLGRFQWVLSAGRAGAASPLVEVSRLQQVIAEASLLNRRGRSGRSHRLNVARLHGDIANVLRDGRRFDEEAGDAESAWAEDACRRLEANLSASPGDEAVRRAADAMAMSYEGFRKRFARLLGASPGRYRAARVMDRACELMQEGGKTDKQIALTLGFCDEFHFSRRFKAIVGCPPREFRRRVT